MKTMLIDVEKFKKAIRNCTPFGSIVKYLLSSEVKQNCGKCFHEKEDIITPYCNSCLHNKELKDHFTPGQVKKVIDLHHFCCTVIDMEFQNSVGIWWVTNLVTIRDGIYYTFSEAFTSDKCRVRQNHYMGWKQSWDIVLPAGLFLRVYYSNNTSFEYASQDTRISWPDVIGIEVLAVADGWCYEWEKE